jgi:hypothetical protein
MLLLSLPLMAQDFEWQFETVFPPDTLQTDANGVHGIAVDPDGKVWLQPFGPTGTVVVPDLDNEERAIRQLFVFNPDGTPAAFSPINFVDYADGTTPRDTLGGFIRRNDAGDKVWEGNSGRGLVADRDGNILVSAFRTLWKLDYRNGQGLARADFPDYCALTQATADEDLGHVYVAPVCPGPPIRELDANLNVLANVRDAASNFSRSVQISRDGLTFYETMFENTYVIIHTRADEFSAFDSTGVAFRGMRVESPAIHPTTGNLWVSAGNNLNLPNQDPLATRVWRANTWYEFHKDDLATPLDSLSWYGCESFTAASIGGGGGLCEMPGVAAGSVGRPRGLAFSPNGERAYVAAFTAAPSEPGSNAQLHVQMPVSIETGTQPGLFTLSQNYPNPFSGSTTIDFEVEEPGHVTLRVFDVLGRQVAVLVDGALPADSHTARLDAGSLATGTYVYTLELNGQVLGSRRMLVIN